MKGWEGKMKKIPSMFIRDRKNMREIFNEPHPDCGWVFAGEGVATRKYDGTCVLIQDGKYYKRRTLSKGKPIPPDFMEADFDETTGKRIGWVPVTIEDKWHQEGIKNWDFEIIPDGTYELIGPKLQGNPEHYETHELMPHKLARQFEDAPRTFDALKEWLRDKDIEGLVFHHPDGRMAKVKKKDFGLKRDGGKPPPNG